MTSRRNFLKGTLAGGAAAAAVSVSVSGPASARDNNPQPEGALGLLYDATLCVGCKACVAACKEVNGNPAEFSTPEQLWDTPLDTTAKTFNVIKMFRSGTMETKDDPDNGYAFMKTSCLHCNDPSCVSACPVSAMTKDPVTGIVGYDADACIGCRYCVAACPFGIPKYDYSSATGRIGKCELCRHRLPEGKYAACAEVCPTGATLYGKVSDLKAEAERRLSLKPGTKTVFQRGQLGGKDQSYENVVGHYVQHVYGEKEVGGTQVIKLSAVPFEKVGHKPLPERSASSKSETLQHTLYGGLVMPLAVLGAMTYFAKRNVKPDDDEL
jgi:Fe-S-cluster-containing dehydrogenase component